MLQGRDAGIRRLVSLHRRPSGRRCCFSPRVRWWERLRETAAMASLDTAQLSALASSVDDTIIRVAELGERLDDGATSDAANALFEAERSLKMARRSLERAGRALTAG